MILVRKKISILSIHQNFKWMAEKRQFEDPLMSGTVITRLKKIYDRPNNVGIFNIEIILKTNDYVTVINTCYFPFFFILLANMNI